MPRANASAPPEAIRIEDEVWDEAFSRREPASDNRRRRLRAIDGDQNRSALQAGPGVASAAVIEAPFVEPPFVEVRSAEPRPVEAPAVAAAPPARAGTAPPVRRTVKIQGRGAERNLPLPDPTRRPTRRAYERDGFRPDRLAMWAVVLGFLLVFVAIASAHA